MRLLVICTHNSARSQMAEGFLRKLLRGHAEVASAGTQPSRVHPLAITVMQERSIDLSNHRSKSIAEYADQAWDYVITVCDSARETCPYVPARHQVHISFPDPSAEGTIEAFRAVRDAIESWAKTFAQALLQSSP